ncbi:hypothetical protein [Capybara microvirus Cap1_SP_158]|nr:hypothetical protein [Capybara microvirus Cap1_SP_158]
MNKNSMFQEHPSSFQLFMLGDICENMNAMCTEFDSVDLLLPMDETGERCCIPLESLGTVGEFYRKESIVYEEEHL